MKKDERMYNEAVKIAEEVVSWVENKLKELE
jgi:hypothetical protein